MPWKVYSLIEKCTYFKETGKHCNECLELKYDNYEEYYQNSIVKKTLDGLLTEQVSSTD